MNILITGLPGVGKTTLVKQIIALSDMDWGGFFTEDIRERNSRVGFKIIATDGTSGTLAHIHHHSLCKVGKYRVNLHDLDAVATAAIERALHQKKSIVMDEIGKMELFSEKFRNVVQLALNSPLVVLATITAAKIAFVDQIKRRSDIIIVELQADNRKILKTMILDLLARQGEKDV